jgi:hypothetical protein
MENLSQVLIVHFLCMQVKLFVLTLCHARHINENIFSVTVDVLVTCIKTLIKCFMLNVDNRKFCYKHRRYKHTALYKQITFAYSCKIDHFTWQ